MDKRIKTYIILRGIVDGSIRDNIPRIHEGKIETGKDLIGIEVKEGRVPHDTRDGVSATVKSRSAVRRHVNV